MYMIDANVFMNWVVLIDPRHGALLLAVTLGLAGIARQAWAGDVVPVHAHRDLRLLRGSSSRCSAFAGKTADDRPWHFFLDMKYQPKYTSQGQSRFFADGRSNRLPPENTIPFDGTDYIADAGRHSEPNPDFLKGDRRYYFGIANAGREDEGADGVEVLDKPVWKDGKLAGEGYFVNHIPPLAVERAGGWEPLIKRGQRQFTVHCAVCHGASGRGGGGEIAFGIVGAYGLSVAPVEPGRARGPGAGRRPAVQHDHERRAHDARPTGIR